MEVTARTRTDDGKHVLALSLNEEQTDQAAGDAFSSGFEKSENIGEMLTDEAKPLARRAKQAYSRSGELDRIEVEFVRLDMGAESLNASISHLIGFEGSDLKKL